jgi:hypothetical protein
MYARTVNAMLWDWIRDRSPARSCRLADFELYGKTPYILAALGAETLGDLCSISQAQVVAAAEALGLSASDLALALQTLGEYLAAAGLCFARMFPPTLVERVERPTRMASRAGLVQHVSEDGRFPRYACLVLADMPEPQEYWPDPHLFCWVRGGCSLQFQVRPADKHDVESLLPPGEYVATIEHGSWGALVVADRAPSYRAHAGPGHETSLFDADLGLCATATLRTQAGGAELPNELLALTSDLVLSLGPA